MRKKINIKVTPAHRGERLDHFLTHALSGQVTQVISKSKVRKLIMAGAVFLNRNRVKIASKEMIPGANIEVMLDTDKLFNDRASLQAPFELSEADVLYEDSYLIAVNKPSGLPTQPTLDPERDHLYAALQRFLMRRNEKRMPYVGLHHRLDFDTSGIVLFTVAREANAGVSALFSERTAQKTYLAVGWNIENKVLENKWVITNHIGRSAVSGKGRMKMAAIKSGGDFAETHFLIQKNYLYRTPAKEHHAVLVEAQPKTGRTHQIRVHMSEYGLPVIGDLTYGLREREPVKGARLMLHAWKLEFRHPMTGKHLLIKCPVPTDFSNVLNQLETLI
jgi:RluA family pseudouridine synthase